MKLISNFFSQLKRRGVIRAAIAYMAGAWALVEFVGVLSGAFTAPEWLITVLLVLLSLGLPAVLVFSWIYDITPEGIRRTQAIADETQHPGFDRKNNFVIISVLLAALVLSVYGNFRTAKTTEPPQSMSILIADFRNDTGNELFSGIIEESLRIGLEVAPFVASYSRKRAADIASEIRGTDDGSLTSETAGLVALREGINIVVGGSVVRDGSGLVVEASGFAPGDQRELFSVSERATTDADILNVVAKISEKLRLALGDTEKPAGAGESESFVVANLEAAAEYLKAQDLQLSRKLEEAVMHYKEAVRLDPGFARAYAGLALAEGYLGRTEAASEHWKLALAGLSTLTERGQLRTLANYYFSNQQDYEKALDKYEELVKEYPADNVAHNNLAVTAFYAMDFARALEVGRTVANRFPDHSAYGANLSLYAMYASRFDEAADAANKVIAMDSGNAYANFVVAQTQAVAGNLDEAKVTYQKMFDHDQFAKSVAAEGIADLALYQGDQGTALEALDAAIEVEIELNALHTVALKQVMRADAYLLSDDEDNAIAALTAALENEAGDPAVLVPAAIAYIQLEKFEPAQTIIDTLSTGFSKSRRAYAEALRAQMASKQGDVETAISTANAAIELADLWFIRLIRANVFLEANQMSDAKAGLLVCQQRNGEGIAVFLNDRPTLRLLRKLEIALHKAGLS